MDRPVDAWLEGPNGGDDFAFAADPDDLVHDEPAELRDGGNRVHFAAMVSRNTTELPPTILPSRAANFTLGGSIQSLLGRGKKGRGAGQYARAMQQNNAQPAGQDAADAEQVAEETAPIPSGSMVEHQWQSTRRHSSWTADETHRFFKALQQYGTDFSLISVLFPGKQRDEIRRKFKFEERRHPDRVAASLSTTLPIDETEFNTGMEEWAKLKEEAPTQLNEEEEAILAELDGAAAQSLARERSEIDPTVGADDFELNLDGADDVDEDDVPIAVRFEGQLNTSDKRASAHKKRKRGAADAAPAAPPQQFSADSAAPQQPAAATDDFSMDVPVSGDAFDMSFDDAVPGTAPPQAADPEPPKEELPPKKAKKESVLPKMKIGKKKAQPAAASAPEAPPKATAPAHAATTNPSVQEKPHNEDVVVTTTTDNFSAAGTGAYLGEGFDTFDMAPDNAPGSMAEEVQPPVTAPEPPIGEDDFDDFNVDVGGDFPANDQSAPLDTMLSEQPHPPQGQEQEDFGTMDGGLEEDGEFVNDIGFGGDDGFDDDF